METRHHRISFKKAGPVPYFYIDYEGADPEEATIMLQALMEDIQEHKLPFIANFKGLRITPKYLGKANEWIDVTRDIVPFGAFIGFNHTHTVIFEAIKSIHGFKHRAFRSFENAEAALEAYYADQFSK